MGITDSRAIEALQKHNPEIIVMIPLKNAKSSIRKALMSIADQKGYQKKLLVIISDDNSSDSWDQSVQDLLSERLFSVIKTSQGSSAANRNFLLSFIKRYAQNAKILIRLDADDYIENNNSIRYIEKQFFSSKHFLHKNQSRRGCNILLLGTTLSVNGEKIDRINRASQKFSNFSYVMDRLYEMTLGDTAAELPSSSLVWSPELNIGYPNIRSAEDHFLLAHTLFQYKKYNFYLDEDEILVNYSLSGQTTDSNKKEQIYLPARKLLFYNYRRLWNDYTW